MDPLYELHADICKVFSNARRLEILNALKEGELSASELIEKTGIGKVALSQQMGVLKAKGVVLARKEGINIHYRIANPKILQVCSLMREVLLEQIREKGHLVSKRRE